MSRSISRFVVLLVLALTLGQGASAAQQRPVRSKGRIAMPSHDSTRAASVTRPASGRPAGRLTPKQGSGGATTLGRPQLAQQCGTDENPCAPFAWFPTPRLGGLAQQDVGTTSGQYTGYIQNQSVMTGASVNLTCTPTGGHARCSFINPVTSIGPGETIPFNFAILGKGVGADTLIFNLTESVNGLQSVAAETATVVVAGTPLFTFTNPASQSGSVQQYAALTASFDTLWDVLPNNTKSWIDGVDRSSVTTTSHSGGTVVTQTGALGLAGGLHSWRLDVCFDGGRCDEATTSFFYVVPPPPIDSSQTGLNKTPFPVEDVIPPSYGITQDRLIAGALPLPPIDQRGCGQTSGDPDIWVDSPASLTNQVGDSAHPSGRIFRATEVTKFPVSVTTMTIDHPNIAGQQTCATLTWIPETQYFYQLGECDYTEPDWNSYPYGDRFYGGCYLPPAPPGVAAFRPFAGSSTGGAERVRLPWLLARLAATLAPPPSLPSPAMLPSAGAIDVSSYQVTLNGVMVYPTDANNPAQQYRVTAGSLTTLTSEFEIPQGNPALHQVGWNELLVSIADSTGRRSTIRDRFYVSPTASASGSILRTADRDLTRRSMGQCVAFGAVQCDEIFLAQPIPGFISRDKDRSLHLVYRSGSQGQKLTLPVRLQYPIGSARPDSMYAFAQVGGITTGPTLRYAGTKGAAGGNGAWPLATTAAEDRMIGAELTPVTTAMGVRQVNTIVREFKGGVATDNVIAQNVVEFHLGDTLATRFGAGWQLAEFTQLLPRVLGNKQVRVLVNGDGSYYMFTKDTIHADTLWHAPADVSTQLFQVDDDPVAFRVAPPDGSVLGFYIDGRPAWAQDQLGNRTTYGYTTPVGGIPELTSLTDPDGTAYQFAYTNGRVTQVSIVAGGSTRVVMTLGYNASGQLIRSIVNRSLSAGDTTTYTYTAGAPGAMLASVTTPARPNAVAPVTSFTYDTIGWTPVSIKRPAFQGVRDSTFYRSAWRLAVPQGYYGRKSGAPPFAPVRREYYRFGSMDVVGRVTEAKADPFGGPTWVRQRAPTTPVTLPDGTTGSPQGDIIRTIARDAYGRVTEIVGPMTSAGKRERVRIHYASFGQVDSIWRSSAAYPTPTGADSLDLQTFTFDTASIGTVAGYAAGSDGWCVRTLTAKDPLGIVASTVTYMPSGRQRCLPQTVKGYGPSNITTFSYVGGGVQAGVRPTSVTDPLGLTSSATYDPVTWNTASTTAPATGTTTMAYNAFGEPIQSTASDGRVTILAHDYSGRDSASRIGLGPVTRQFYGPDGLVDSVAIYAGVNGEGSLTTVGSPQVTRSFYNGLGLVDSTVAPGRLPGHAGTGILGRVQRVHYTKDLQADTTWMGNGTYLATVYDWLGRPIRKFQSAVTLGTAWGDAATATAYQNAGVLAGPHLSKGSRTETWYDLAGRVASVHSVDNYLGELSNHIYAYSPAGAVVADTGYLAFTAKLTRSFQYDRLGRRLVDRDTLTGAHGGTVSGDIAGKQVFAYDPVTQLLVADSGFGAGSATAYAAVNWTYDVGGREILRSVALNGSTTTKLWTATGYTSTGLLDSIRTSWGTAAASGAQWYRFKQNGGYNAVGDLLGYDESINTGNNVSTGTTTLTYSQNGLRQLLSSNRAISPTLYYHYNWAYDAFNNRITQQYTSSDAAINGGACFGQPDTSSYGADNRLTRMTNSLTLGQNCSIIHGYVYDYAGQRVMQQDSLTSGYTDPTKRQTMTYTAAGQLYFSITTPDANFNYPVMWNWYDGSGLRAVTKEATVQQAYPLPDTTATGPWTYYLYDGGQLALTATRNGTSWSVGRRQLSSGVDRATAMRAPSGTVAFVSDRQGTFQTALTPAGAWDQGFSVTASNLFGAPDGGSRGNGGNASVAGFAGAAVGKTGTGFVYMRNRWYDPQTGRFLTQDPIGLAGGVNLYAYAGNNPVAFDDPFGLWDPHAHRVLLEHALSGVASARQITLLEQGSAFQDIYHNWDNRRHFLRDADQTPAAAASRSQQWIGRQLEAARKAHLAHDEIGALEHLGAAMHTIMDATSPSHVGADGPKVYPSHDHSHSMCDICGGHERTQDITPEVQKENDMMLKNAYDYVYRQTDHQK